MNPPPTLGTVMVALAVTFVAIAFQNYLKAEGKLTPARKTWLRVAFIFAAIAIVLFFTVSFRR
jgi:hypothetical protein